MQRTMNEENYMPNFSRNNLIKKVKTRPKIYER